MWLLGIKFLTFHFLLLTLTQTSLAWLFIYFKYSPLSFSQLVREMSAQSYIMNITCLLLSLFHLCTILLSNVESISLRECVQSIIRVEAKWAAWPHWLHLSLSFLSPPTHSDAGCLLHWQVESILASKTSCSTSLYFLKENIIICLSKCNK